MRSYRELWLWLGAALLTLTTGLLAIALAYFTKEPYFSLYDSWQFLVSCLTFTLGFGCFLAAVLHRLFPPWAKAKFPNINVIINGVGHISTHREMSNGIKLPAQLISYRTNVTNLEREQNANLTFGLRFEPMPGSGDVAGETHGVPVDWTVDSTLSLSPLPRTLNLAPGTTVSGDLVFQIMHTDASAASQPKLTRLVIKDYVSDSMMATDTFTPSFSFTTADMHAYQYEVRKLIDE
jgi:hypothetical protein